MEAEGTLIRLKEFVTGRFPTPVKHKPKSNVKFLYYPF